MMENLLNLLSQYLLNFLSNNILGLVSLILIISSVVSRSNQTIFGAWIANIFGTVLHEIAHFTIGKILRAKPVNFSIMPRKTESGYILGHVDFKNLNWFNSFPTAMAPFMLLYFAFLVESNFWSYFEHSLRNYFLYIYLLIILILNAIPSKQDYKVAFQSFFGVLCWIGFPFLGYYFLFFKDGWKI